VTNPAAGKHWLKSRPGRVALAVLGWTILGCVFALPDLSGGDDRRRALLLSLTLWWSWGIVTPLILWVDRRIPVSNKQLARRVLAHLLPSLLVTCVYVYVLGAVRAAAGIGDWPGVRLLADAMSSMILWNWLVYWLILGAWQAHRYYDHYLAAELRLERLEKNFSEARLNALRMQLDPHFLFNALNTISSQVERDPKLARRMIEHLGDLLRLSLESKDRQEVPLAEEMAFLEHYLAIQKIRFGDRLRIETQIAPEVKYASVGGKCDPSRDFKAGFGWDGDCLGAAEGGSARHSRDRRRCGASGGLDAGELRRRGAFGDAAARGGALSGWRDLLCR
jgi:two-component system, LytTR family, sensor kinase